VALEDRCPHRFAPLSIGRLLDGNRVQCIYHGLEIGSDGTCVHNPHGDGRNPTRARVVSYPVVERHLAVWIWMGDQPADPARIPDFSVLDNVPPMHLTKPDRITVKANYELIVDNLLDDSHTCFVHEGLLGNAETVASDIPVEVIGDDVVVSRYANNVTPPGMFTPMWPDCPSRVDKFTRFRWMAPSYLTLYTGICEPGQPWETGTGYHGIHMLTPEEHGSTHYFFTAARWNVKTDASADEAERERIARMRRFAFQEQDAPVIEHQQRVLDKATRRLVPVVLKTDAGPVRYKRILERMLAAEAEA
jgi:vanillate O-demethylase monooxygenase subunit